MGRVLSPYEKDGRQMHDDLKVLEKRLIVPEGLGLHARVATSLVKAMQEYSCRVTLTKDNVEVSAGSVLGLLLLAAGPGSELLVRAAGPDSVQAIEEIVRLIQNDKSGKN
jgi:phosphocarrier protein